MKNIKQKILELWREVNFEGLRCTWKANCSIKEMKDAVAKERELAKDNDGKE